MGFTRSFRIGTLFKIQKVYGKPLKQYSIGSTPYITGADGDCGRVGFVAPEGEDLSRHNCIAVDPIKGFAYYQLQDFVGRGFSGASINLLYHEKLNEKNGVYICSAIEKVAKSCASYTNLFNSNRLNDAQITLPAQVIYTPDFEAIKNIASKFVGGGYRYE